MVVYDLRYVGNDETPFAPDRSEGLNLLCPSLLVSMITYTRGRRAIEGFLINWLPKSLLSLGIGDGQILEMKSRVMG
jgi:hypothetical protein